MPHHPVLTGDRAPELLGTTVQRADPGRRAVSKAVRAEMRSGLCDITVTTQDGDVIAQFRGRSRTVPLRKKA